MSHESVLQPFRESLDLQIDYAGELNEQQLAAVTAPPGPSLVIAGAGSGKTRTLIYRVAFLLEQGIPPERILLLTFTNKAANEMMRRVTDLLGRELPALWGGTFHSIGNRILRHHAELVGYLRDFTILDREDVRHLIKACLQESGIDVKQERFPKAEELGDIFSLAVNTEATVADVMEARYRSHRDFRAEVGDLQRRYTERKRRDNAMDFDDLLALWLRLLREQPEIREHYQRRFQFILVDEYQDTNRLQGELIDLLAERSKNVMVVGDDAQSIYAWRGANFENILRFPKRYPGTRIYKIETNYRSTPEILEVANAAITANEQQFNKELAPARRAGLKPFLVPCYDAKSQALFVARRVLELREEGVNLNHMAVLYRSHFHALELQLELTRHQIPFSIASGTRFFEQAHIKDVTSFLKLVLNPRDELSFKRLAKMLPGVGGKAAQKLWEKFGGEPQVSSLKSQDKEPESNVQRPKSKVDGAQSTEREGRNTEMELARGDWLLRTPIAVALQDCVAVVPKKAWAAWAQFVATVAQLEDETVRNDAWKMIRLVLEAGYEEYLKDNHSNYRSRLEDLEQLSVFAQQFASLEEFLTQLALLTNLEAEDGQPAPKDEDRLRLSTVHQAKGLEFDVVFVIMLCDGMFPSSLSLKSKDNLEEERRLMYVAITRARNELYLCYPLVRGGYGTGAGPVPAPSRFLLEIPKDLIEEVNLQQYF